MREFFQLLNEYPWTSVMCVFGAAMLLRVARGDDQ